jgi:N-acetylglucosamine malate deacetylase 1
MKRLTFFLFLFAAGSWIYAQEKKIRIIVITAHPDEADEYTSGTCAIFAEMGHDVKFVSLTNGDSGHWLLSKEALAKRRLAEAKESGRRLGVAYDVLNYHDGELENSIQLRKEVVKLIREWKADIVIGFFPADGEHPDNRNAGRIVQDAASFVANTPLFMPEVPALDKSPLYLYMRDYFTNQLPHHPDIVIGIDQTIAKKYASFDAHASQFYEFAPYQGGFLAAVPKPGEDKKAYFDQYWGDFCLLKPAMIPALEKWYGKAKSAGFRYAEAFEFAPFGRHPTDKELRILFPMLK